MARLWQDIEVQRDGNTVTLRVSDQNAAVVRGPGSGSDISSSARSTSFSSTLSWDPLGYGGIPAMHMFKDAELEPHLA